MCSERIAFLIFGLLNLVETFQRNTLEEPSSQIIPERVRLKHKDKREEVSQGYKIKLATSQLKRGKGSVKTVTAGAIEINAHNATLMSLKALRLDITQGGVSGEVITIAILKMTSQSSRNLADWTVLAKFGSNQVLPWSGLLARGLIPKPQLSVKWK